MFRIIRYFKRIVNRREIFLPASFSTIQIQICTEHRRIIQKILSRTKKKKKEKIPQFRARKENQKIWWMQER